MPINTTESLPIPLAEVAALSARRTTDLHAAHINSIFPRSAEPLKLLRRYVRAEGMYLWDDAGERYHDFFNGFGCLNLGHNHPRVVAALREALDGSLPMIHQLSPSAYEAALAHNLAAVLPQELSVSYFQNSGSEAVEAAIKLARLATGRRAIVSTCNAYHGRTLGALSLTGMPQYTQPFEPLLPGAEQLPFGDTSAIERRLARGDVAALVLEPIQGQGGVHVPADSYLTRARELCSRHGTLLVFDEVQTGFGRTGRLFAFEHVGAVPDVLLTSKSLGGGLMPLSAITTSERLWTKAYGTLKRFVLHGSTFSGNTLACVAGLAALEAILEERLPERAAEQGRYFFARLAELKSRHHCIKEVRGRGLMIGIVFDLASWNPLSGLSHVLIDAISPKIVTAYLASRLLNEHRIIVPPSLTDEYLLRVYPVLAVTRQQIDYFVEALDQICASVGRYDQVLLDVVPRLVRSQAGA
ncbi:MAG TPA: aspartate aminotransferase family protein [Vicinamibacterales bacterium]|nr:aspartate aminotransferase family protein [Vicinamibacterales bacterium]